MSMPQPSIVGFWIARDENKTLEFKRLAKGIDVTKCLQTLVAFANTAGGRLVLGMEDFRKAQGVDRLYGVEENPDVEGGLLVVADPSAARSQRRYTRPGASAQEDLFGNGIPDLPDHSEGDEAGSS